MSLRYLDNLTGEMRLKRRVIWAVYGFSLGVLVGVALATVL